ncbi:MAG: hypothetical protein JW807_03865 [Spirochaetes bacterium]|nr:hypothetical protein [Spirochaetota bacterium]
MLAKKIFIGALCAFIVLILVQTYLKPFGDMILSGVEVKARPSISSPNDVMSGTFQDTVEAWLKQNIGFRGYSVKSDNQINYSLFNEFSRSHPRRIILGKNKQLYELPYIDNYNRNTVLPRKDMEAQVADLKKLQQALARKNIRLLLTITPSKASIYPEYIPDKFINHDNLLKEDNYQILLPLLRRYGVDFLDGREMFIGFKKAGVPNIFPTSGSHWSLYGAYLFTEKLIERMEGLLGRRMVHIESKRIITSREPIELDKDIARLGNILFTRSLFTEYLYPDTRTDAPANVFRPDILIVGSSFCWNFIEYLDRHRTFSRMNFYYYFNTDYLYPGKKRMAIEKDSFDWHRAVSPRDLIIIEANEIALGEIGYGFIRACLDAIGQ